MLERLSIENYALIQQLELELSPSLNIITGETGAGKSILLGALGLIMGNRADTAVLKDSGRNCVIEGLFDMGGYGLETFFDENELDYERHTVIRRIVTPAGKSRAYVNDLPVQLATLRELAAHLIDIHSQNQGVLVADGEFRIRVLDSLADNRGLRAEYGRAYRALREREQELARLREEVGRNRRDEEYMRFQWQQIAALGLHEGELQELEAEQRELSNAEGILAALSEAGGLMENDETGVLAALKTAEAALQRIGGVLEGTSDLAARIHSAYVELKDVSGEVASLAGRIEDNPARLEAVDNRIGAVSDLMRRYGAASSDELLALGNDLATRLEAITDSDAEIAELEAETGALRVTAEGLAAGGEPYRGIGPVRRSRRPGTCPFRNAFGAVRDGDNPFGCTLPFGRGQCPVSVQCQRRRRTPESRTHCLRRGDVTRHAGPEIHRGPEYQTSDDTVRRDRHRRIGKDSRCDGENNRRTGRLHAGSQYHAPAAGGVEGGDAFSRLQGGVAFGKCYPYPPARP